ncbi:MAG: hypothetical protein Hals2KO_19170 [Halioglobus sp.]
MQREEFNFGNYFTEYWQFYSNSPHSDPLLIEISYYRPSIHEPGADSVQRLATVSAISCR